MTVTRHPVPEEALAAHMAIVGKVGSGKTYAAKGIVERLLEARRRVCVIDPTGAWWGLRSSADGRHAGYPVAVFGGEHADVPIAAGSGAALASLIAGRNMPAVIDVSEFLIGERHRFMEDFAAALYRENRTPLHLIIDEADDFAPQNPLPESKRMLHRVDQIVRRGRIRGFRVMLITQRPAVLHKNVLTQANTLIAMRLVSPQDRKAIEDWIKGQADAQQGKDVLNSLAKLQRGEGWIWSPEHDVLTKVAFPKIRTFDSSRTPEDGEEIAAPTKIADVDLDAIRGSLEAAQAEAAANDPKALKARIVELERAAGRPAGATPAELNAEYTRGREEGFDAALVGLTPFLDRATTLQASIDEQLGGFIDDLRRRARAAAARPAPAAASPPRGVRFPVPAAITRAPAGTYDRKVSGAEQRILDALAELQILGVPEPERVQVAFLAGYTHLNSKGLVNALGALRTAGMIDYPAQGRIVLTASGQAQARAPEQPRTADEVQERVMRLLGGASERLLRPLVRAYPKALERADLASAAGYGHLNSKGFVNAIGRLRSLGFVDYPRQGAVVAQPVLFLGR